MVSHIVFWGSQIGIAPRPFSIYICMLYKSYVYRCVEVKCILILSTYSVFSKSIDSKDDNYCTELIQSDLSMHGTHIYIRSASNVSDENEYSTKVTGPATIHTHAVLNLF